MSSAMGQVKFRDGTIMFFRYCGTKDVANPVLHETKEQLNKNWRKEREISQSELNNADYEDVEIANDAYGNRWKGVASKDGIIHSQSLIPDEFIYNEGYNSPSDIRNVTTDGLPEWWDYD